MAPPSEFDLRAALRDGEGDELNVDDVISAGQARRAQRRSRILSAAVIIAVVGGLGLGAAEFGGGGGSGGSGGGSADAAHGQMAGGLAVPSVPGSAKHELARISCPSAAPSYAVGGLNKATRYGSATQLFTGRVTSVVVCAYGPAFHAATTSLSAPARLELAGRQATRLAHSLERAPTAAPSKPCPSASTERYAVIPVNASGVQGLPVTAQLSSTACGAVVTNGTAVRYGWQPPPDVAAKLDDLSGTTQRDSPAAASQTVSSSPRASPTN